MTTNRTQTGQVLATIISAALWLSPLTVARAQPAPARDTSDASPSKGKPGATPARPAPGARPGEARPGEARPGEARPGEARPGEARPGEARPGEARPGEARPSDARPTPAREKPRPGVKPPARPAKPAKAELCVKKKEKPKKKPKYGWFPKLSAGLNLSMVHNYNVPGVDDGLNLSIGVVFSGNLKYLYHGHEWVTDLKFLHTQSKTPTLKPFLKTADALDLKSIYQYRFKRFYRLALFGGLHMTAAAFPGDLVTSADTALTKVNADGTTSADSTVANKKYRLTPAFTPVSFKQFIGAGIQPSTDPMATLDLELAFAVQEIWARGYTVNDDSATPEMELKELQNFQQMGPQLVVELNGKLKKRLTYAFRAEFLLPTYVSIESTLRGFDLISADVSFKVGVKVTNWASLDYVFSAKRLPLIIDQWQVLNNLVLSITAHIL